MGLTICIFSLFVTSVIGFPSEVKEFPHNIKECRRGEVIENECNTCICSSRKVFECIRKKCNSLEIETSCRPDTIYVTDGRTCICNRFGKWPHQDCSNIFQNLSDKNHCEPNTYVTVDCNICRCGSDGKIDEDRCTKNSCQELKNKARRQIGTGQVYGACDRNNWYSLAPCQFCYCVNENKLVCNTGNSKPQKLELGSYKLNVCGKDLLRDANDLVPQDKYKEVLRYSNIEEISTEPANLATINSEIQSIIFGNDTNNYQAISPTKDVNYDTSDSESKSSESEDDSNSQIRIQEYTAKPSTVMIESEESTEKNVEKNTEVKHSDYSNEIPVETIEIENVNKKPKVMAVNTIMKSEIDSIKKFSAPAKPRIHQNYKHWIQPRVTDGEKSKDSKSPLPKNLNLPGALNKVFQIALRKSMVSIVEDTKCKPGTTTAVECNVCFCTNDAKMMCTNTKCQ